MTAGGVTWEMGDRGLTWEVGDSWEPDVGD